MKVIVVGAGILGAAVALHLSRIPGLAVTVMERGAAPAAGVTGLAFGWVNLIYSDPDDSASYQLRQAAFEDHLRLLRDEPVLYGAVRRGSLIWKKTPAATEAMASRQKAAGTLVDLVDARAIGRLEPHLALVPEVAAYVPDDIALSPAVLAANMLADAAGRGASLHYDQQVVLLQTHAGRIVGVQTADGVHGADAVVIAGGEGTGALVHDLFPELALSVSPTILFEFAAQRQAVAHIVCGPDIEVRQNASRTVIAAEGYIDDQPENAPARYGQRVGAMIEEHFPQLGTLVLQSARVGYRPMLSNGMPHLGPVPGVDGLHLAVGHPGVILAPLAGRRLAEALAGGG